MLDLIIRKMKKQAQLAKDNSMLNRININDYWKILLTVCIH